MHKPSPTFEAMEGFLAGVNSLVDPQVSVTCERLSTGGASIRFFARVDPLVLAKIPVVSERLLALSALVRSFSRVYFLVPDEMVRTGESGSTYGTFVRPLPGVDSYMAP